jgi:hypothetical protein
MRNMKDNGLMMNLTEKVFIIMKMEIYMMVTFSMDLKKDMEL